MQQHREDENFLKLLTWKDFGSVSLLLTTRMVSEAISSFIVKRRPKQKNQARFAYRVYPVKSCCFLSKLALAQTPYRPNLYNMNDFMSVYLTNH